LACDSPANAVNKLSCVLVMLFTLYKFLSVDFIMPVPKFNRSLITLENMSPKYYQS
jgi:hypothetical protein